jgi:hypothetical protein
MLSFVNSNDLMAFLCRSIQTMSVQVYPNNECAAGHFQLHMLDNQHVQLTETEMA